MLRPSDGNAIVTSDRWEQIAQLYHQLLDQPPSARTSFIVQVCGDDVALRRELETLLAQNDEPGLMDRPVWNVASDLIEPAPALASGTALGPYQIDRLVGEGGMGQVFRAVDTRLNRTVAVKILPPSDGIDPLLRERFGREAQAGASLAHPHICALYDVGSCDGVDFIVMEYLEGDTLAAQLAKGPLPLDRTLQCAIDVASALDHAHRSGIVHRDVKPANIMLTRGGAKLMDFGIAKRRAAIAGGDAHSTSLTAQGTIVGTIRYMSPEQVEGRDTDHRSDLFSLGAVIYEMVTGRPAFEGSSPASTMAAILEREPPPMATLQQLTPPALDHVVRRCLAKQPDERWQSAGDVMRELKWVAESSGVASAEPSAKADSRSTFARVLSWAFSWPALAAVLGGTLLFVLVRWSPWRPDPTSAPVRFHVPAVRITAALATGYDSERRLVLAPDGTRILYQESRARSRNGLMVQRIDQFDPAPLPGTAYARVPFFSPDGKWIGYYDDNAGELRKIASEGGSSVKICKVTTPVTGASWGADDTVVFSTGLDGSGFGTGTGLMRVSVNGGEPETLTKPDPGQSGTSHQLPSVLPGGRGVLFTIASERSGSPRIAVLDRSGKWRVLLEGASGGQYVDTGHLLFVSGTTLNAVPFDLDRLDVTGAAVTLVDDVAVARSGTGAPQYAVSATGTLVYVRASAAGFPASSPVWVDRGGAETSIPGIHERRYRSLRLSPTEDRIALDIREGQNDTWVFDSRRQTLDKVTTSPHNDDFPLWSPDGRKIVTGANPGLSWRSADGSGDEALTTTSTFLQFPMSFTPDGTHLVLAQMRGSESDLYVMTTNGSREIRPLTGLNTPAYEIGAELSPDGRWLAYQSNESGQSQIYVRPFPDVARKRFSVSAKGGFSPAWSRDGRELFYIAPSGEASDRNDPNRIDGMLTAVPVIETGGELEFEASKPLFNVGRYVAAGHTRSYDVSRDGKRFLFLRLQTLTPPADLVVVVNWIEELKARMRQH